MPTQPSLKTKFQYEIIPNTAQYKWSNWENHRVTNPGLTLESAKSYAERDKSIAYFFHMKSAMYLEQISKPGRSFSPGDAVFFSGENMWLGSALGMSDTHLVSEQYDMSDKITHDAIMATLRQGLLIDGVDASKGTKATPQKIKAGWVFVAFNDVAGGDIPALRTKLEGSADKSLKAFIKRESNGRVDLEIETYGTKENDVVSPAWVTLPENHTAYENDYHKLAAAVDEKIEFPNDWNIAMFAFPDVDLDARPEESGSAAAYETGSGFWIGISQCIGGQLVDKGANSNGQIIHYTFTDPSHYKDTLGAHVTTIHEAMHAFRLLDIYYSDTNRSYGWSIMSAAGAGSHITQFEKLLLGWEDPENFIFLKRGVITADALFAAGGVKGVIILPEGPREDTYFIEVAQEIGVGEDNRKKFVADNQADYGLLLMIVRKDRAAGIIMPYVSKRPDDARATELLYGGASKAPFKKTDQFSTNGIFSYPAYYKNPTGGGNTMGRIIGVNGAYSLPDNATMLRENDRIALGDEVFMLNTTGCPSFGNGAPCLDADCNPAKPVDPYHRDFGYVAFVDNKGVFHVVAALDAKPTPAAILTSYPTPPGLALSEGEYFFKLEKTTDEVSVGVYKKGVAERQYTLFRKPQTYISRGWKCEKGRSKIQLGADGNLVVTVDDQFRAGSIQKFGDKVAPAAIIFGQNGKMTWLNECGKEIKTFSGNTGVGPFALAVSDAQANNGSLVVVDANGRTLYAVFDY